MKNITNTNTKGQWHGYQECYVNGKIWVRGNRKNGQFIGYGEYHSSLSTRFFIR